MDQTVLDALSKFSAQLDGVRADTKQAVEAANDTKRAVTKVSTDLGALKEDVEVVKEDVEKLKKAIPPAPPTDAAPPAVDAVAQRVTNNEGEIAELSGRLLSLEGQIKKNARASRRRFAKANTKVSAVLAETTAQTALIKKINGSVTGFFGDPRVIMTGRIAFAGLMAYAVSRGWIAAK